MSAADMGETIEVAAADGSGGLRSGMLDLPALPTQPDDVPWPVERWPTGRPDPSVDQPTLDRLVHEAFGAQPTAELALSLALVVVHRGMVVREAYGPGTDRDSTLISWSMAKSMVHALVGFAVDDGLVDPSAPAPVDAWADDARSMISVEHLLRMASGLRFAEEYVDDTRSDVIEMLFGSGRADMGAFAASFPLDHRPGTVFNYSSGTTNILARILRDLYGGEAAVRTLLTDRLFGPLGMTSATATFDPAGTFVGSSFVYATARDFARFGLLYLRGGRFADRRVLPPAWIDHARTPTPLPTGPDEFDYGAHWWLTDPRRGIFHAGGYEGQRIIVVPDRDLVVVRLGKTPAPLAPNLRRHTEQIVDCFAAG